MTTGGTSPDPDVHRLSDGSYYNKRLRASNVWEVSLPSNLVDQAADIFYGDGSDGSGSDGSGSDGDGGSDGGRGGGNGGGDGGALCERVQGQSEPYSDVRTPFPVWT